MSSVRKVRSGLFVITWGKRPSPIINKPKEDINVANIIPGYNSCHLQVRLEEDVGQLVMEMSLVPNEQNTIFGTQLDQVLVVASYKQVQVTMKFLKGCKWQARWWFIRPNFCAKCEMAKCKTKTEIFELVIDFQATLSQENTIVDESVPFQLYQNLVNNKSLTDIIFRYGNQNFRAHSSILLSCCSPKLVAVVKTALSQDNPAAKTKDTNTITQEPYSSPVDKVVVQAKIIEINVKLERNIAPTSFGLFLKFLYTGQVQFEDDVDVYHLLHLATWFEVDLLLKKCFLYLKKNLRVENATDYLDIADYYKAIELKEEILNFMARNAEAICSHAKWLSFVKFLPEVAVEAMKRMVTCV